MQQQSKKHVFVGMSGGVDSCATVKILLDQGYLVTGVTFVGLGSEQKSGRIHRSTYFASGNSRKCCSSEEVIVAKNVCHALGIQHFTLDLSQEFLEKVRQPFVESFLKGETPNPCMLCNRHVKIGALVEYALSKGADYVAMGHYSGVECVDGEYLIKAGADKQKDQSYFLALLKPEYLPKLLFPLATKEKYQIREIIENADLPLSSNKVESQDICFVDDKVQDYLKDQGISKNPGTMLADGQRIGQHDGVAFYALGQRKGLGVSLGKKAFIRRIDAESNTIELGDKPYSKVFTVIGLNIFSHAFADGEWDIQIRYRSPRIRGFVKRIDNDTVEVHLDEPQEIVSPGQFAVFYKNDYIYAAGKIHQTILL